MVVEPAGVSCDLTSEGGLSGRRRLFVGVVAHGNCDDRARAGQDLGRAGAAPDPLLVVPGQAVHQAVAQTLHRDCLGPIEGLGGGHAHAVETEFGGQALDGFLGLRVVSRAVRLHFGRIMAQFACVLYLKRKTQNRRRE